MHDSALETLILLNGLYKFTLLTYLLTDVGGISVFVFVEIN